MMENRSRIWPSSRLRQGRGLAGRPDAIRHPHSSIRYPRFSTIHPSPCHAVASAKAGRISPSSFR